MSRRDARDKVLRVLEVIVEILGFAVMLIPLMKRKPKQNRKTK